MKQALSARYGGMLIHAMECDYNSFRHLHLLCPNCKRSVFLVGGKQVEPFTRHYKSGHISQVKGFSVDPYFAHHPDVSGSEVEACELRVRSMTEAEKQKIQTQSRKQLLKVLHKHFSRILQTNYMAKCYLQNSKEFKKELNLVKTLKPKYLNKFYNDLMNHFINGFYKMVKVLSLDETRNLLNLYITNYEKHRNKLDFETVEKLDFWKSSIDKNIHSQIVYELLQFLIQNNQRNILKDLIKAALYHELVDKARMLRKTTNIKDFHCETCLKNTLLTQVFDEFIDRAYEETENLFNIVLNTITRQIFFTDWAGQYEKYEKE